MAGTEKGIPKKIRKPAGQIERFFKKRWHNPSLLLWDPLELIIWLVSLPFVIVATILWGAFWLVSRIFRPFDEQIGKIILQAQKDNADDEAFSEKNRRFLDRFNEPGCEVSYQPIDDLITHDHVALDTIEIRKKMEEKESDSSSTAVKGPKEEEYHIYFFGMSMAYQDQGEIAGINVFEIMRDDVLETGCCAIGFNYRNVGNISSKVPPRSTDDLVIDGIAQVQRLRDLGVPAEKITLDGVSLGAGIATLVAAYFHDVGYPVKLRNDRGFSTVTNCVLSFLYSGYNLNTVNRAFLDPIPETWGNTVGEVLFNTGRWLLGLLIKPIVWFAVKSALCVSGWEINAAYAYRSIPSTHKTERYVRSSKQYREAHKETGVVDDPVISDAALHNSYWLIAQRFKERVGLRLFGSVKDREAYETRNTATKIFPKSDENRNRVNAHLLPRNKLTNASNQTGVQLFDEVPHSAVTP